MQPNESIIQWLDFLRQFVPPTGLVFIGTGTGVDIWVQYLQNRTYANVVLVEADEDKFKQLKSVTSQDSEWLLRNNLIAPRQGSTIFYRASNSNENGLLKPELLHVLWPNLTARKEQTLHAITLQDLRQSLTFTVNWIFIDCFPAMAIMEPWESNLEGINIIVARVLHGEYAEIDEKSGLPSMQATLKTFGFRMLALEPDRHPRIGHVLFMRELRPAQNEQQIQQLETELIELKLSQKLQTDEMVKVEDQMALLKEILLYHNIL
jgi:hypothetical protein